MSEYPEALIEKVAAAIRGAYAADAAGGHEEFVGDVGEWAGEAVAALDALGLREEKRVVTWDGRILDPNSHGVMTDRLEHRFATDWGRSV